MIEHVKPAEIYRTAYEQLNPEFHLRKPKDFEDGVLCMIEGRNTGTPCPLIPNLVFRAGEITLWGGICGHGKSLITGQIAMRLAELGEKSCIISLEMSPEQTLFRMLRQWLGHFPKPQDAAKGLQFFDHFQEHLLVFDYVGSIETDILFGAIAIAAKERHCKHIFIDNLMRCVAGEDDYNTQKEFVQSLCVIARQLGVHVHLVHHVRKGKDESEEIGKFSFKGTGAVVDQVDNAVLIQRNRKKEKRREEGILTDADDHEEGDSLIRVVKQRNGDWEGTALLWFNPNAAAFCQDSQRRTEWATT